MSSTTTWLNNNIHNKIVMSSGAVTVPSACFTDPTDTSGIVSGWEATEKSYHCY